MDLFFADKGKGELGRPFILSGLMQWVHEVNHFLYEVAHIDGKTSSPNTWRAYGYHILNWLNFCEKTNLDWRHAREKDLATYRIALDTIPSQLTKKVIKRESINGMLGTICLFYRFALKKRYITRLPFDLKEVKVAHNRDHDEMAHLRASANKVDANRLKYRTYDREIEIPPNSDVGRFIRGFKSWRDRLIAETMWLTNLRRAEVCTLDLNALPEDPFSMIEREVKISILGKGKKRRYVKFPVRLLRSIARYIKLERNPLVKKHKTKTSQIWVGKKGQPIKPKTVNKAFESNARRCGLKINPHDLRHSYAINRLLYLESIGAKSPLKILQGEMGHAHQSTTERYLRYTDKMQAEVLGSHGDFIDELTTHLKEES